MGTVVYPIFLIAGCLGLIGLVLIGYPLLLWFRAPRTPRANDAARPIAWPSVDVITVVRDGALLMEQKIDNTFKLDYPADRLRLICCSDGSTDGTEEILRGCRESRLIVDIQAGHRGKNAALNSAVELCNADILVLSDADALLDRDAVRRLVLRIVDSADIGGVCGRRVIGEETPAAANGQHSYLRYDGRIKVLESRIGSITSNDGKLYAVRSNLVSPVPDGATDDLFNAMAVVRQGKRFVFEPDAIARIRVPSRSARHEVSRRRRIVSRSLRGIYLQRSLFNPFRFGFYALGLLINKVVRRLLPFGLVGLLAGSLWLAVLEPRSAWLLASQVAFYAVATAHVAIPVPSRLRIAAPMNVVAYFCLGNVGTLLGLIDFLYGRSVVKWDPVKHGQPENQRTSVGGSVQQN